MRKRELLTQLYTRANHGEITEAEKVTMMTRILNIKSPVEEDWLNE